MFTRVFRRSLPLARDVEKDKRRLQVPVRLLLHGDERRVEVCDQFLVEEARD